jgi:hypothetical protein
VPSGELIVFTGIDPFSLGENDPTERRIRGVQALNLILEHS